VYNARRKRSGCLKSLDGLIGLLPSCARIPPLDRVMFYDERHQSSVVAANIEAVLRQAINYEPPPAGRKGILRPAPSKPPLCGVPKAAHPQPHRRQEQQQTHRGGDGEKAAGHAIILPRLSSHT
jgi:hypothetical protein